MKRKNIIALVISIALILAMSLASCSKEPETLEKFINNNEEAAQTIQDAAQNSGLDVSITENDVVYTYDLKNFDGMTDELAKSDKLSTALGEALDANAEKFTDLCKQLQDESKIEGIKIIVNYTYDGETIASKTFNVDGVVEE